MRDALSLMLVVSAGCVSSAKPIPGVPLNAESKHGYMGTRQRCSQHEQLTMDVQLVYPVLLDELQRRGHKTAWSTGNDGTPIACMIEQPEPCDYGRCKDGDKSPRCIRRRGCACAYGFWIARLWPPICRPWWPDEQYCAAPGSKQSSAGYRNDLSHEIQEMLHQWRIGPPPHSPAGLEVLRAVIERIREN